MRVKRCLNNSCTVAPYIAVVEREKVVTHTLGRAPRFRTGWGAARWYVKNGLVVLQYQDGIECDGEKRIFYSASLHSKTSACPYWGE